MTDQNQNYYYNSTNITNNNQYYNDQIAEKINGQQQQYPYEHYQEPQIQPDNNDNNGHNIYYTGANYNNTDYNYNNYNQYPPNNNSNYYYNQQDPYAHPQQNFHNQSQNQNQLPQQPQMPTSVQSLTGSKPKEFKDYNTQARKNSQWIEQSFIEQYFGLQFQEKEQYVIQSIHSKELIREVPGKLSHLEKIKTYGFDNLYIDDQKFAKLTEQEKLVKQQQLYNQQLNRHLQNQNQLPNSQVPPQNQIHNQIQNQNQLDGMYNQESSQSFSYQQSNQQSQNADSKAKKPKKKKSKTKLVLNHSGNSIVLTNPNMPNNNNLNFNGQQNSQQIGQQQQQLDMSMTTASNLNNLTNISINNNSNINNSSSLNNFNNINSEKNSVLSMSNTTTQQKKSKKINQGQEFWFQLDSSVISICKVLKELIVEVLVVNKDLYLGYESIQKLQQYFTQEVKQDAIMKKYGEEKIIIAQQDGIIKDSKIYGQILIEGYFPQDIIQLDLIGNNWNSPDAPINRRKTPNSLPVKEHSNSAFKVKVDSQSFESPKGIIDYIIPSKKYFNASQIPLFFTYKQETHPQRPDTRFFLQYQVNEFWTSDIIDVEIQVFLNKNLQFSDIKTQPQATSYQNKIVTWHAKKLNPNVKGKLGLVLEGINQSPKWTLDYIKISLKSQLDLGDLKSSININNQQIINDKKLVIEYKILQNIDG
ncbi:hypothetical protein PPERSA_03638 [Pseudocohnilembus persalinus]|uniref:MHD domain-containing protein n=1 Tax=Pseudocohnilembus persalinus TaxID=266149 RepID=A0A0V0QDY2_PSEPJ|nr:hypothetical protein PPERSA_03638 [Pseudocohnilembus persalinus]|eukprot:KRX00417.1 hypothetical protein PPERSA_03638 [Pseudocohnilembus persalinus]